MTTTAVRLEEPEVQRRNEQDLNPSSGVPPEESLDSKIEQKLKRLSELRDTYIYPLFIGGGLHIDFDTVDDVYDSLMDKCRDHSRIEVVINSGGGDLHAAYNLALLFRRFGREHLRFIVPRWAKSAAALLVCAGDVIYMGPVAELGPLDPQITQMNPLERRLEEFSPLHIEATLELIRDEFTKGHNKLAGGLLQRLQFPLTLGGFKKSLEIGKEYLSRLLSSRMFQHETDPQKKAQEVAEILVGGYQDHGFCIDLAEAGKIGLHVEELPHDQERITWDLYKLNKQKEESEQQQKQREMQDALKSLPPDLLRQIVPSRSDHASLRASLRRKAEVRTDVHELASRVAAALLTQRGELTMSEIRAIPFVRDESDAQRVLTYLMDHLKAESGQRKISSNPVLRWERYVRLKDHVEQTPAS